MPKPHITYCPNCNKGMKYQSGTGRNPDYSKLYYEIFDDIDDDPESQWFRLTCSYPVLYAMIFPFLYFSYLILHINHIIIILMMKLKAK